MTKFIPDRLVNELVDSGGFEAVQDALLDGFVSLDITDIILNKLNSLSKHFLNVQLDKSISFPITARSLFTFCIDYIKKMIDDGYCKEQEKFTCSDLLNLCIVPALQITFKYTVLAKFDNSLPESQRTLYTSLGTACIMNIKSITIDKSGYDYPTLEAVMKISNVFTHKPYSAILDPLEFSVILCSVPDLEQDYPRKTQINTVVNALAWWKANWRVMTVIKWNLPQSVPLLQAMKNMPQINSTLVDKAISVVTRGRVIQSDSIAVTSFSKLIITYLLSTCIREIVSALPNLD